MKKAVPFTPRNAVQRRLQRTPAEIKSKNKKRRRKARKAARRV